MLPCDLTVQMIRTGYIYLAGFGERLKNHGQIRVLDIFNCFRYDFRFCCVGQGLGYVNDRLVEFVLFQTGSELFDVSGFVRDNESFHFFGQLLSIWQLFSSIASMFSGGVLV